MNIKIFTGFRRIAGSRILGLVEDLRRLVGARIRTLRQARGLTQEKLGELARLSYKFIGEIERGAGNPTLDSLARLATALDVSVADLVSQDETLLVRRLSPSDYQMVREARDSLESLLGRLEGPTPRRKRPRR
ncbi:MAG: helix-turn-helix transcriptional regulator [Acidobacteria bacterium]|nr:helix-turn-helix transcriptional regulator [Acidobacteriota bacterium]